MRRKLLDGAAILLACAALMVTFGTCNPFNGIVLMLLAIFVKL